MEKSCILFFSTIFFLTFSLNLKSQNSFKFEPEINIGISARCASIELLDYPIRSRRNFGFTYDQIEISRNRNFVLEVGQFVYKKKIFVGLSSYFRYGHFHYKTDYNSQEFKRFKYDVFFDANYHLKWKEKHKSSLILGLGIGYMNLNTGFNYDRITGEVDANGNILKVNTKGAFGFMAPRFLLGIDRNKFKAFVIVNGTRDDDYRPNPTIWLEFKATYALKKFNKK